MHNQINSSSLKIIYIITELSTGGAETMLYNLLSKTNKLKFKPIVVSLMDRGTFSDRFEALGISVYTINMKQGIPTLRAIWQLIRLIRRLQPDIIQGWMYHGNLAAQFASIFYASKIPILWSIHHSIHSIKSEKILTQTIIKLGSSISRFPNKIAFVSQKSKSQHQALGYDRNKLCVIPNGFDTDLFQPSRAAKLSVREELNLPPNSFLIGLIAAYRPMKDHPNFLQAAALLKDFPHVHFVLAGTNVDNNNQVLHQLIQDLGITNQVHLLGERRDIHKITAGLDIVSLSSAYGEAFPLVLGEAMSCGVPCVVTDIGDSAWIVGDTGRVVPPQNAKALADAWKELITLGIEKREALGLSARARIIESFSLESVVAKYESLYDSFLNKDNHV